MKSMLEATTTSKNKPCWVWNWSYTNTFHPIYRGVAPIGAEIVPI